MVIFDIISISFHELILLCHLLLTTLLFPSSFVGEMLPKIFSIHK